MAIILAWGSRRQEEPGSTCHHFLGVGVRSYVTLVQVALGSAVKILDRQDEQVVPLASCRPPGTSRGQTQCGAYCSKHQFFFFFKEMHFKGNIQKLNLS